MLPQEDNSNDFEFIPAAIPNNEVSAIPRQIISSDSDLSKYNFYI